MCDGYVPVHKNLGKFGLMCKGQHRYGDRLVPGGETANLHELDGLSVKRGITQLLRFYEILGFEKAELLASYTVGTKDINIMEELGIKGLTSLCVWQNWQDGGWGINHWGVPNQPYYPRRECYTQNGEPRDIMCFTMGNSSCTRNYSIMTMESCPSLVVPGERYSEKSVLHFQAQRFYDAFDGYIQDAQRNEELTVATVGLESFAWRVAWNAVNNLAVRYMVKKAAVEKIVFTSAADVQDYHRRKHLPMQRMTYFQPDIYYGYRDAGLTGNVPDRIEIDHPEFLAVLKKGSSLPLFFYDYQEEWGPMVKNESGRNAHHLVHPEDMDVTKYYPPQVDRKDMEIDCQVSPKEIRIRMVSGSDKKRMVTAVFDVPLEKNFTCHTDWAGVTLEKVTDPWSGNTHLTVIVEEIRQGEEDFVIVLEGAYREPRQTEVTAEGFAARWFGDHAYLRSEKRGQASVVRIPAPEGAYWVAQDGIRHGVKNGELEIRINEGWHNEAPILYGFSREAFCEVLDKAEIQIFDGKK